MLACAAAHDLGAHVSSWRWTKYSNLIGGLITGYLAFVAAMSVWSLWPTFAARVGGSTVLDAIVPVLLTGFVTVFLLAMVGSTVWWCARVVRGVGRSLHQFDGGLVVATRGSCSAWPWRDVANVTASYIHGSSTSMTQVRIVLADGRRLAVDRPAAAPQIDAAVRAAMQATRSRVIEGGDSPGD